MIEYAWRKIQLTVVGFEKCTNSNIDDLSSNLLYGMVQPDLLIHHGPSTNIHILSRETVAGSH